jgi:hypothetical protein
LPVPETVAEHWLFSPTGTLLELHDTLTDVIVAGWIGGVLLPPLLLPPPQAARAISPIDNKSMKTLSLNCKCRLIVSGTALRQAIVQAFFFMAGLLVVSYV